MKIAIVIPTYNEKDNIRPLTEEILKVVPEANILFVDDNSPDGTGEEADALAKQDSRIAVLHRKTKEGLGGAYIAGFKEALRMNPDYIIQMDADFSHSPEYIPLFLKKIGDCDLVLGSRFIHAKGKPPCVSTVSLLANRYTRRVLDLKVRDCLGGFKCFRREFLDKMELNNFISKGFVFQAEFIYKAHKRGFSIKEVPINFRRRKAGKTKKTVEIMLEAFFKIIFLRLRQL